MSDQPTVEWTADKIPACLQSITEHDWGLICDARNAALAAERESSYRKGKLTAKAQLAAERERYVELCDKANRDMIAANRQLAAERDAHYGYVQLAEQHLKETAVELAAELEREKPYPRFKCLICKKGANELASPYYLERVSATGKGAIALWLCTEHLNQQLAAGA